MKESMIKIDDIELDESLIDYQQLRLVEGHLMHEVRRKGKKGFFQEYSENIEDFRRDWRIIDFCFLLALLEYLDNSFKYDESVRCEKYIAERVDFEELKDNNFDIIFEMENDALDCFKKRGLLFKEVYFDNSTSD